MSKTAKFEPYKAQVSQEVLGEWNGVVRVWSEAKSAVEGAEVVYQIKKPVMNSVSFIL